MRIYHIICDTYTIMSMIPKKNNLIMIIEEELRGVYGMSLLITFLKSNKSQIEVDFSSLSDQTNECSLMRS